MKTWEVIIVFGVLALVIYEALKQVFGNSVLPNVFSPITPATAIHDLQTPEVSTNAYLGIPNSTIPDSYDTYNAGFDPGFPINAH